MSLLKFVPSTLIISLVLVATAWADGESIYQANCAACHQEGVAGAPKLDDQTVWAERIEKGIDGMVELVISGIQGYTGVMPPRGGNPNLSDEDIRAAVEYMVAEFQ